MACSSQSSVVVSERMDVETTRFSLKWTINNFKQLRKKSELFNSAGITMQELGHDGFQGRWRMIVSPCSTKTEEGIKKCCIQAFLSLTDVESFSYTSDKSVDVEFVVRVSTGKEATVIFSSKDPLQHTFCRKDSTFGYQMLMSHNFLFGDDKKPGLLKDDVLTFVMDVTMYGAPKAVNVPEIIAADSSNRFQQFVRRQAEAVASHPGLQSTDFKIHSSDGQVFPTYRILLISHSPVFATMLSHNLKENQLSLCELEDIDGETVAVLLDYVHGCDTGKVTVSNAERVLIMADKYEILDLCAVCEEVLAKSVTAENAVHYLVLASQRKLDKLKEAALNMTPKNMGTVLKNGALEEVLQFDPQLVQTIMEHCSKRMRLNHTV